MAAAPLVQQQPHEFPVTDRAAVLHGGLELPGFGGAQQHSLENAAWTAHQLHGADGTVGKDQEFDLTQLISVDVAGQNRWQLRTNSYGSDDVWIRSRIDVSVWAIWPFRRNLNNC